MTEPSAAAGAFAAPTTHKPGGGDVVREILLVARYEILELALSVRSLLLVVAYGMVAGGIGAFYLWVNEKTQGKLEQTMRDLSPEQRQQAIDQFAEHIGRPLADAIFNGGLPPLVLTVLFLSTFAVPGLILLVGYSAIAEDVSTKFARYILQRVRRPSFLIGKILAHFVVCYLALILVHALLLAYATTRDNFDLATTGAALPRIWGALAFFVLAYVAYSACFSSAISPPFGAFALGAVGLCVMWVASFFPGIRLVWLGRWDMQLWALDPAAIGVYLGWTVALGGLAYLALGRRDV